MAEEKKDKQLFKKIRRDGQVIKFGFYGFFKNLQFFEPYLLIYLNDLGFNLFQIGLFYSIRSGITYIFEVPSAVIAEYYGKKNELYICFSFYIISFILFFFGNSFWIIALGMIFYGFGEAFRSGTHKGMILAYLEQKGWFEHKGYVYGITKSYSLLGSALSAFLAILFVLQFDMIKWIFVVTIIPFVLDFILIATYPESLNDREKDKENTSSFWKTGSSHVKHIFKDKLMMKIVLSASAFNGVFKSMKDYIQPILSTIILSAGVGTIASLSEDESLKLYLGVVYGLFYIFSSFSTKNVYRLSDRFGARPIFSFSYDLMGVILLLLAITVQNNLLYLTIGLYFILYFISDARTPVFVEVAGDVMDENERVTVLSVESQIRALGMMVLAPAFGFVADTFSVSLLFLVIGIIFMITNRFLKIKDVVNNQI